MSDSAIAGCAIGVVFLTLMGVLGIIMFPDRISPILGLPDPVHKTLTIVPETPPAPVTKRPPRLSAHELNQRDWFGAPEPEPKPETKVVEPPTLEELPETSLGWALMGIFQSTRPEQSSAVVAINGQPGKLFTVGELISDGARLIRIEDEAIVIDRDDRLESLYLYKERTKDLIAKHSVSSIGRSLHHDNASHARRTTALQSTRAATISQERQPPQQRKSLSQRLKAITAAVD